MEKGESEDEKYDGGDVCPTCVVMGGHDMVVVVMRGVVVRGVCVDEGRVCDQGERVC